MTGAAPARRGPRFLVPAQIQGVGFWADRRGPRGYPRGAQKEAFRKPKCGGREKSTFGSVLRRSGDGPRGGQGLCGTLPIILSGNNIKIWSVNIWGRVGQSRPKNDTFFDDFELPKHHFFTKIEKPEKRRSKTTRENRPKIEVLKNDTILVINKLIKYLVPRT